MDIVWPNKEILLEAANKFRTPFYFYNAEIVQSTFQLLNSALPKNVDIFYSMKANPNIAICQELCNLGACAELCSLHEINAAIYAGFEPRNIIFVGPAKLNQEIEKCIELGVYAIICESLTEYHRISDIAKQYNKTARVALRINPSHISKTALLKMGGKPSQFGMDEEIIFENRNYFLRMPNIDLVGIHIYNGTRILNAETIIENTNYILNLARKIQTEWQMQFEMVDIGGGLGVPYHENEQELNLNVLSYGLQPLVDEYRKEFPNARIILESGRFLIAKAGVFVSQVVDIKTSKNENFIVTDGGSNCHMAASGMGSLIRNNFPIEVLSQNEDISHSSLSVEKYNITGPLCTPGDLIGKQVSLPKLSIGDFVVVKNSGAYGPTASPVMFLSHGFPAEVLLKNSRLYLIRERFMESDFMDKQYLINKEKGNETKHMSTCKKCSN
ncbi:type III PLP-dependent enzyme [Legionella sp. km535]|uniref:type III PLP-dependent enzyme n=1 Tax=Legionella sp. km535 TaxID=2498107 RepID=UPI000F8C7D75|nr:type III PLP-dependent enzyme [Legionella sp. km535]RUR19914.1 type III PLP-dependent enzyme [Legionella sp. km535]